MKARHYGTLVMLVLALGLVLLAGCAGRNAPAGTGSAANGAAAPPSESGQEPITLTFFDKNTGDAFDNPVAREITKRTGVTIEVQQPTGNPAEKLNLMLASDDLPDIVLMDRSSDLVNKYIAAGAIIPLNDLIDEYGPDVAQMYGDTLNKTRYEDGKNYFLSNWYGLEHEPINAFNIRYDWMKELAPDKAEGDVHFTAEEFKQLLVDFKAKYPQIDGTETIPLTMNGESFGGAIGSFKGMFGIYPYYNDNGALKYDVKDPKYREMVLYMNELFREGLIDREWAVNKEQSWLQKLSSGAVLATTGSFWSPRDANNILRADHGEDAQFYGYKVVAPGVDPAKTTYGGRSSLGWDAIAITKKNRDPARTMQFINFLASEEGQYLLMWGVEGEHWDMVDGVRTPRPEVFEQYESDPNFQTKSGVRKWTWFIKNGPGTDGLPYDLLARYYRTPSEQMGLKTLDDTVYDSAPFDALGPVGGTAEALIEQKVEDIITRGVTTAILAASAEEANRLFDQMLAEMQAAGDVQVEEIITDNYQKRLELWQ